MQRAGEAQSALRAHSGRSSRGLVQSRSLPQVSKATSTRRHSAAVPPGQAARHDPRWQTLPVAQSESRTQKLRGAVSTWQKPSTQTSAAAQARAASQPATQRPSAQADPAAQSAAREHWLPGCEG